VLSAVGFALLAAIEPLGIGLWLVVHGVVVQLAN
jgi:hypothetical protein